MTQNSLARDAKNNKGFYSYFGQKGKVKESVPSDKLKELVTADMDKAEVFMFSAVLQCLSGYIS